MGACATKFGDLKLKAKGEPPLVVEDGTAALPVAEGGKANKADVSRRRSLSDLLKEQASDEEAGQEAVKVVTVDSAGATGEDAAPASLSKEADEAEQLTDDPNTGQETGGNAQAASAEEEKRVDPDSVRVVTAVAALSAEGC